MNNEFNPKLAWSALLVIVIGTIMSMLDQTIVNVAIPTIVNDLNTNLITVQWIVSAYALTLAAVIPLTSYLVDAIGSKRLYISSLILFIVGSMLCGLSTNINQLIFFRIIQAIGGGMMAPIGMMIILDMFPASKRGSAFGVYGVAAVAAPAIGPTLGGFIVSNIGWRAIFYINVPIGIFALIASYLLLQKQDMKKFGSFDIIGYITFLTSVVFLIYILGDFEAINLSSVKYIVSFAIIIITFIIFIFTELKSMNPLINLKVLKNGTFVYSTILVGFVMILMMAVSYTLPIYLQSVKGATATESGLIMLPSSLILAVGMLVSGRLLGKIDIKKIVVPGFLVLTIGTLMLSNHYTLDATTFSIILSSCIIYAGISFIMMPINTNALSTIDKSLNIGASQISNICRQLFTSIGVIVVSNLITTYMTNNAASSGGELELLASALSYTAKVSVFIIAIALVMSLFLKNKNHR